MNDPLAPIRWLVFLALWRMSYEAANINRTSGTGTSYLIQRDPPQEIAGPRQKEWTEKAIKGYAAAQEKKWRRWNEAMFERSD